MANETTSTTLAVLIKNKMKVKGTYRVYGSKPKKIKKKK
jgi:hypothetical protein